MGNGDENPPNHGRLKITCLRVPVTSEASACLYKRRRIRRVKSDPSWSPISSLSHLHNTSIAVNVIQCIPARVHSCSRRLFVLSRRRSRPPSRAAIRPPPSRTPPGHPLDTSFVRNLAVQPARPGLFGTSRLSSSPLDTLRQVGHRPGHFSTLQTMFLWTNKSKFQVTCSKFCTLSHKFPNQSFNAH
jgi:hypothetical protein